MRTKTNKNNEAYSPWDFAIHHSLFIADGILRVFEGPRGCTVLGRFGRGFGGRRGGSSRNGFPKKGKRVVSRRDILRSLRQETLKREKRTGQNMYPSII